MKILRAEAAVCLGQSYLLYRADTLGTHINIKVTLLLILIEGDLYVVILYKEQVVCSIAIVREVISGSLSLSQTNAHSVY